MSLSNPSHIDRRQFLVATGGTALASTLRPMPIASAIVPRLSTTALRTITYNILACRGFKLTDDNRAILSKARKQIPARIALELALYEPDIVTFQESPAKSVVADIANRMGMNHTYFRGGFPGAVISRFEITESTNKPLAPGTDPDDVKGLFTRHWGRAVLKTDDDDLVVYSVHMHPGQPDIREKEVTQMLAAMDADLTSNRSIILQGDLNHTPDGPEYQRWVEAGLRDAFAAKGTGDGFSIPSTEPRKKIDYVWAHGPLADRLTECSVLFEGDFRTNPQDPKSFALSDHIPVLAVFE
ncbi:MAG: endonuclease/exonuclease/phosphatase family protein [Planctomycetes bacterium]|nr:endonuclease/exonuclease/phosphatase family protein [Planctomycetota bacterium]